MAVAAAATGGRGRSSLSAAEDPVRVRGCADQAAGSGGDERRQRSDFEGGIDPGPSRCVARARAPLAAYRLCALRGA